MKSLSLKTKLLAATFAAITLLCLSLVISSYSGISGLTRHVADYSRHNITESALLQLRTEAGVSAEDMSGYIERAFRLPASMASNLAASIASPDTALSRAQVSQLIKGSLVSTPELSASYVFFEPNAYDGQDSAHLFTSQLYNTVRGSLEVYWIRHADGSLELQEVDDPDEKYSDTLDEFGNRESEWYLCPRDTLKPCLVEPYGYELNGETVPMTSMVYPLIHQNRFLGMTGADINLPVFQTIVEQLSQSLYQGQAKVTLLSSKGLVVASSHYTQKLMRPFSESISNGEALQQLHKTGGQLIEQDTAFVAVPVIIADANTSWSLVVELPLQVALAGLHQFQATLDQQHSSVLTRQLVISLVLAIAVLALMALLIRSIIRPLNILNAEVEQLASGDGDLSQRLNLDTHAELIRLGNGFNHFLDSLHAMISQLKAGSGGVREESAANLDISRQTASEIDRQHNEIDHVVTATQEMSATAQEVAGIASSVSTRTQDIHQQVTESQSTLTGAVDQVLELTQDMSSASESIQEVAQRSDEINNILVVIRGIAEQTNLLALNAAIEAARAGEQGRGFAVVADEVRTLASRTQTSTEEINAMISTLQTEVDRAVEIIGKGNERALSAMQGTQLAHGTLNEAVLGIREVADNITQVATAAEEQSSVSDEIARNLTVISDAAQTLSSLSQQATQSSQNVAGQLDQMDRQLALLKT
ncbi:MAG: methyl-accepting chemotaxis protein [Gammaproteobacteria bacterium]|nr:methyl-accepting chemotaxis protein [Gammaproteobacteria bacterium]